MSTSNSLWTRSWNRLFGTPLATKRRPARRSTSRRFGRFESLEDRSVMSATFGSAFALGGAEGERVFDMKLDAAGNTYVTGYYMGTADFDQERDLGGADILTAKGGTDAFVAKYAPDNSLLWVRPLGGDAVNPEYISEAGRSLAVDQIGNVFVTGEFWGRGSFGSTELVSTTNGAGFIAKLSPDGNFAWAKPLGASGNEGARGVDVDAQGNAYALLASSDANSNSSYTVQKLNAAGQSLWTKSIVGGSDLAVTGAGSVSIVGSFTGKVDFDPGPKAKNVTAGTNNAAFVLNLDTNGNFRWVTPFIGSGTAFASTVEVDGSENVYIAGRFYGSIDFDPSGKVTTLTSSSNGASYITKLSSSGSLVWARGLTGGALTSAYGLAIDATGNVYATGTFYSSIDLNPGAGSAIRTTSGASDGNIFVVKLSSAGNYVWGETFGSTGLDIGYGLAIDSAGQVVVGGTFGDVVDFDPSLSESMLAAAGQREAFVLRLNQS